MVLFWGDKKRALKNRNYLILRYKKSAERVNRTPDTRLFRPLLYLLSYLGVFRVFPLIRAHLLCSPFSDAFNVR